jgi:hypothetical protein
MNLIKKSAKSDLICVNLSMTQDLRNILVFLTKKLSE